MITILVYLLAVTWTFLLLPQGWDKEFTEFKRHEALLIALLWPAMLVGYCLLVMALLAQAAWKKVRP